METIDIVMSALAILSGLYIVYDAYLDRSV
jgi:hypothetical protein